MQLSDMALPLHKSFRQKILAAEIIFCSKASFCQKKAAEIIFAPKPGVLLRSALAPLLIAS